MNDKRKPRSKGGEADPAQYERFLDAAREHGCEENVGRLDEVVRRTAKLSRGREKKRDKTETKS